PGVNIAYQGAAGKNLEYTIVAQPGADLSQIHLTINGAQGLSLDAAGNLDIQTPGGTVVMQTPVVTQTAPAGSSASTHRTHSTSASSVAANFVLENANTIRFQVTGNDPTQALVIDPIIAYSGYLGGGLGGANTNDLGLGVAVDPAGDAFVIGQ